MKKYLGILLVIVAVFMFSGCGKDEAYKEYAGLYTEEYENLVGDPDTKTPGDGWTFELKEDGTGTSKRNGAEYNLEWHFEGDKLENGRHVVIEEKFAGITNTYTGNIDGKTIDVYNGDQSNAFTLHVVFKK